MLNWQWCASEELQTLQKLYIGWQIDGDFVLKGEVKPWIRFKKKLQVEYLIGIAS
jgi:hypothetical protein